MRAVPWHAAGRLLPVHDEDPARAEPPQFDRGCEAGRAGPGDEHVDVHAGPSRAPVTADSVIIADTVAAQ